MQCDHTVVVSRPHTGVRDLESEGEAPSGSPLPESSGF